MNQMNSRPVPAYCCRYCGHPCPSEGIYVPRHLDVDHAEGTERPRCSESACVSDAVCTVSGRALAVEDAS